MKKLLIPLSIIGVLCFSVALGQGTLPLTENFDYAAGNLAGNGNWITISGTLNQIQIVDGNLSYAGYMDPSGRSISLLSSNSEDVVDSLFTVNSGKVYASLLLNVANGTGLGAGAYIIHMSNGRSTFNSRIWIRSSGAGFNLGISKTSTSTTVVWGSTVYNLATTYLLVHSYEFLAGTDNDIVNLWVNPLLTGTEPTPDATLAAGTDLSALTGYNIRETTGSPNATIDGIRIGTSWESILPASGVNQPPSISAVSRNTFIPAAGISDIIQANIADDHNITGAKLHVRVNGGAYDSSITMAVTTPPAYQATMPASKHVSNGDLVEYFISATDDSSSYSSTGVQGYFVGDSPISSIKSHGVTAVSGYGARVNGTLNVDANLFSNGLTYMQDATGGLQLYLSGMPWSLNAGRNVKVEGTIASTTYHVYQLQAPNFSFVDTSLGSSTLTPVPLALPLIKDSSYANEGRLVKIAGLSTDSVGSFAEHGYLFRESDNDTVTVYIQSNNAANTVLGKTIPSIPTDVVGVLAYYYTYMEIKPRKAEDLGLSTGDGSGIAAIKASTRLVNLTSVAETLTVTGDGINTLESASIQIPLTWTWTNTASYVLSGAFAGKTPSISGDGSSTPYVITISALALTDLNPGTIEIKDLNTPASGGSTQFIVKTAIVGGTLTAIASSPSVLITTNTFEAIATGAWNSSSTWSGGIVPTASDDVTLTTGNVVVTITANAECNKLTMVGVDTTGGVSGPLLQFNSSGVLSLTINGKLDISGSPGRPKLTSNGNPDANLILKAGAFTNVSNTTSNGDRGLNMNEGSVKFTGTSTDTLKTDAGFRLGNFVVGDGTNLKTLYWNQTTSATMNVRSLTVKAGSSFIVGMDTEANINGIGNYSTAGVPMLTGGITIETGASMLVNNTSGAAYTAYINMKDGGIVNNGTLNLISPNGSRKYSLAIGELSADPSGSKQTIGGSTTATYSFVKVGSIDTLILSKPMNVDTMLVNGELVESSGNTVVGVVRTKRQLVQSVPNSCGGIGVTVNALGASPDTTVIYRITDVAQTGNGNESILRAFSFAPLVNDGLNATLTFHYDQGELNGQNEATLTFWRSNDNGTAWWAQAATFDAGLNTAEASGLNSLDFYTASDAAHSIGATAKTQEVASGWNLISMPYYVADARKTALYPGLPGNAFYYDGSYKVEDTLKNGIGYWLKFQSDTTYNFVGADVLRDTIDLVDGWNMIGSIGGSVPTAAIVQVPPGVVISSYFNFTASYQIADTIKPGMGYWAKANGAGQLILNSGVLAGKNNPLPDDSFMQMNTLIITDQQGRSQTLYFGSTDDLNLLQRYEMPPLGPEGTFDIRFASGRIMEPMSASLDEGGRGRSITINSAIYPLRIEWNVKQMEGSYYLSDGSKNHEIQGSGSLVLLQPKGDLTLGGRGSALSPKQFNIGEAYPNPFNPTTKFRVEVPFASKITVAVYDLLGKKIRTLVDGEQEAGFSVCEWDGITDDDQAATSGIYFIKMNSEGYSGVRKVALLK